MQSAGRLYQAATNALRDATTSSYLFTSQFGNRLDVGDIHRTFYALSRQIGLRGLADSHGPRLHDMRHVFATNTLVRWYEADQDPEASPPYFVDLSRPCPCRRHASGISAAPRN